MNGKQRQGERGRGGGKAKYTTPTVVDLGELARGVGGCNAGSAPTGTCNPGATLAMPTQCKAGNGNVYKCAKGTSGA
ncbi:MAG: hypothetical protein JXR83_00430 [Deltaproteobacteria bacterium]|nr:hypothetical protein [Deltaproteobacteria bacterium]